MSQFKIKNLINRRLISFTLQSLLAFVCAVTPMTASCQRAGNPEQAMQALGELLESKAGKPSSTDLAQIESRYPQTRAASLARFLRGYLAYTSQNYSAAVDAFDARVIGANTALGDYTYFFRAESEAASGARKEALRDYTQLFTKIADSLKAREARLRAAEMMIGLNDAKGAIKELTEMVEANDAEAIFITGQAYETLNQTNKAADLYRVIYYDIAATPVASKAEDRLNALGLAPKTNPAGFDSEKKRADKFFEARQYWDAAQAYENLVKTYPDGERLDEVQLRRGISLVESKQPAQAVLPLTKVTNRNADQQADAWFYLARALRSSNRAGESAVTVDRLITQFPKYRRNPEALNEMANYLDKASRAAEAAAAKRKLVGLFSKSEFAAEASYELGAYAYQLKNYAEAARLLEQHLMNYRYPETKFIGEACFLVAKSQEKLGNRARALAFYEIAAQRYQYGYDGIISNRRAAAIRAAGVGKAEQSADIDRIRRNATYVETLKETSEDADAIRIARFDDLTAIWIDELGLKELNKALENAPTSPRLNLRLAEHYAKRGDNFQATIILRRGYPDIYSYKDGDIPQAAWEIMFPLFHWETIKQEARRYGIDPYLAAALIRQESVFNPNAISRVGARGLMQLMPATGQLVSKQQGNGSITANDLLNPDLNIKLGMNYLAQMIGQLGRFEYAAAGYNAGPGRAKRWVAERGSLDMEDWIESIPFSETRGYVKSILRYAANYRRFYKQ
ncbi:MAG: transglycosylase SLT domain-containing protein [Acidobacteriota bacterium]